MSAPASATSIPNQCPSPGCTNTIDMMMPACDYCKRKHCMRCRLPEKHGCGDAVKAASQLQANAEARTLRQEKKEHDRSAIDAKARFDAKKAELAAKRKRK